MIHKIGERIAGYRKERKISQEDLAAVLNVSRQTISKWETGDTSPDVYNAVALAKLFHVSLDEIIMGVGNKYGESSYMAELKEKRRKTNVFAILVGSMGSVAFTVSLILLDALDVSGRTAGIVMACVLQVLMLCWGIAIWNFIRIARIGEEIKYLQKIELTNLHVQNKEKDKFYDLSFSLFCRMFLISSSSCSENSKLFNASRFASSWLNLDTPSNTEEIPFWAIVHEMANCANV